ncbi:HalOD1 output domain-containing protein [Halovenus sp. HT40]|uniref:HalOD1 output domain-containing protein n=1 Tax=Halovenus sp. HT40 TaxID=3126691 RepID=UPI00300F4DB2
MSEDDLSGQSVSVYELATDESPSQQVIELVGEKSETALVPDANTGPEQTLPPLHSVVDPDALDALVGSGADSPTGTRVEFFYHGYTVTVCTDRPTPIIRLQPQSRPTEPCRSASASD